MSSPYHAKEAEGSPLPIGPRRNQRLRTGEAHELQLPREFRANGKQLPTVNSKPKRERMEIVHLSACLGFLSVHNGSRDLNIKGMPKSNSAGTKLGRSWSGQSQRKESDPIHQRVDQPEVEPTHWTLRGEKTGMHDGDWVVSCGGPLAVAHLQSPGKSPVSRFHKRKNTHGWDKPMEL